MTEKRQPTEPEELVAGWPTLVASILGIGVGIIAMSTAIVSNFMHDLQADFGWSRTSISLGSSISIGVLVVTSPFVGWVADRVSEYKMITFSLLALGGCLLLGSQLGPDVRVYLFGFGLMSLLATGASTVPFTRVISARFETKRGTALGLAMIGTGVSGVVLPLVLAPLVTAYSWRLGFIALGGLVLGMTPVILILLWVDRPAAGRRSGASVARDGATLKEALKTATFWKIAIAFALCGLAATGASIHLISYLRDSGMSAINAGGLASFAGAALIITRVGTGWLLDRFFAPRLAAIMLGLSAVGLFSLAVFGPQVALLGALAFSLALGCEIDLIGYLSARYFGLRAYGSIYGAMFSLALIGSMLSVVSYGAIRDLTGRYQVALFAAAALLLLSVFLLLTLPAYNQISRRDRVTR